MSYSRASIEAWFKTGKRTSPSTGLDLEHTHLLPNITLRRLIESWRDDEGAAILRKDAKGEGTQGTDSAS